MTNRTYLSNNFRKSSFVFERDSPFVALLVAALVALISCAVVNCLRTTVGISDIRGFCSKALFCFFPMPSTLFALTTGKADFGGGAEIATVTCKLK